VGYYVRVFCTTGEPPAMAPVLDFARQQGSVVNLDSNLNETDPASANWQQVGVLYRSGKSPILLEVNRDDGEESLLREEIEEFLEFLEDAPSSKDRKRVEQHLRETTFTVAAQLDTSDIDDEGYNALGNVLRYFVQHNGGMIQADGEGFYDGTKVMVALE
jgi:hypothetical protein